MSPSDSHKSFSSSSCSFKYVLSCFFALADTRFRLNLPTTEEAAHFAFEQSPQYLYDTITHGQLPFGCHAWRKHQYEEFWKPFINTRQSDAIGT